MDFLTAGKVVNLSNTVEISYVNRNEYTLDFRLWKSAVEKSVENVEKLAFSTGISALSKRWLRARSFAYTDVYSAVYYGNPCVMLSAAANLFRRIFAEKVGIFSKEGR